MQQAQSPEKHVSHYDLFLVFSRIALSGFGGVMFWARRNLVDRKRWLTDQQFIELLTLGQIVPGPPGLNITIMVGYRFRRWTGAAAAVSGFLLWPCLLVIGMGIGYQHFGTLPQVRSAFTGMSIVAAALLFATFLKLARALPPRWQPWLFGALAFAGVGVFRWPLVWVIGVLAPFALLAAWKEKK